jgi:myxalamid-type polyketide synthase MxaC
MKDIPTEDRRDLLLRALQAVEEMKVKLRAAEQAAFEPIAIVGMGCRFPGDASTPDAYWNLLVRGVDAVREIPAARWGAQGVPPGDAVWRAGLVEGLDGFDPRFFDISAREATTMDPQQRMVLEVAWEALEYGGINPQRLKGAAAGVFLGITGHDYGQIVRDSGRTLLDVYAATGSASNAAAGRLAFVLGLQGPAVAVDTACSSSLTAVHLACQSLRSGESRIALAGGVNALLTPDPFVCFANWGMMAPDGRCKTFDAGADGFVRSEGCGMIVLKRLSDALADGNNILALIRGSAVNQDGRSSGLTVPNGPAQEAVIRQALANARVQPADIGFVEAHGTGTSLGDPIEAHALGGALGPGRDASRPLVVGSVKTNIGHLESAAGIAGLIKVVLSLQHGRIPPHLHFQTLNPDIDWKGVPVEIPVDGKDWKRGERPRLAGVSSFGFSGTNAHVVIEEAPVPQRVEPSGPERGVHVLALSARTGSALLKLAERYAAHLADSDAAVSDVCYTANTGRAHFAERAVYVAATREELQTRLREGTPFRSRPRSLNGPRIAFLFSGQGAQYPGMGRELYETEPVFRTAVDRCAAALDGELSPGLLEVLYGNATALLDDTRYTQPALFAIEYALAELWRKWGVEPAVVFGHSVGEYAAACVAGVWPLEDAIGLIAARGRLMGGLPQGEGAMAAILAPQAQVEAAVAAAGSGVSVAALNGPENVVISGRAAEVEAIADSFTAAGKRVERLPVSHAFHSVLMEPIEREFAGMAAQVEFRTPRTALLSSVTGRPAKLAELQTGEYWRRQVREPVRFHQAMKTLASQGCDVFVEIGPGSTLLGMGKGCIGNEEQLWVPSIRRAKRDNQQMGESVAALYVRGAAVDWDGYEAGRGRRRLPLPTYPFERQRYWVDDATPARHAIAPTPGAHPLLGRKIDVAAEPGTTLWLSEISLTSHPWIADHRVQGRPLLPATAYMEMAAAAGLETFGDTIVRVADACFEKPLFLSADAVYEMQTRLAQSGRFEVYSRAATQKDVWTLHATATVSVAPAADAPPCTLPAPSETVRHIDGASFYQRFAELGNDWGAAFQGVEYARVGDGEGWSRVVVPQTIRAEVAAYRFHPALADASGHILPAIRTFGAEEANPRALVGQKIGEVTFYVRPGSSAVISHARIYPGSNPSELLGDVEVFDEDGTLLSSLRGAVLRYLEVESTRAPAAAFEEWFHRIAWEPFEPGMAQAAQTTAQWIVTGEDRPLAAALCNELDNAGVDCRVDGDGTALQQARGSVRVVYTGLVDAHAPSAEESAAESTGCAGLLTLVRALANHRDARLYVVTRGVHAITGRVAANCMWQSAAWGLGRTLAVEHSDIWGGLIDLEDAGDVIGLSEYLLSGTPEDQAAIRDARFLAARLERTPAVRAVPLQLASNAAYVVSGGFRGLGLEIARWLVRGGARHLVLLARSVLPPRSEWRSVSPTTPQGRMIQAVLELEAAGATVYAGSVDVADEAALGAFFESYERDCRPPIRGVIHAAGVLQHAAATEMTMQDFDALLAPKAGAWNLHRVLEAAPLDFFVLFSSASAVIGSPKLGGYAAGNALLDGLASYRAAQGQTALSVNWGVWKEAGMATQFDAAEVQTYAERGMGGMSTAEGIAALAGLMASGVSNAAILPVHWATWARLYPAYAASPILTRLITAAPGGGGDTIEPGARERIAQLPADLRRQAVQQRLAELLAAVAGFAVSTIEAHRPITEYGLDSLLALEFKNRIQADLGVAVTVVQLLEGAPLEQLIDYVSENLTSAAPQTANGHVPSPPDVDRMSDEEVDAMLAHLLAEEEAN